MSRYHARMAFDPPVVAEVREVLAKDWDPEGALVRAAASLETRDVAQPRNLENYAQAICGILAAGGTESDVMGYQRREEEKLLGAPRSTGHQRGQIARAAWRAVRGISLPPKAQTGNLPDHDPAR